MIINEDGIKIYKTLLIKKSDNSYASWEPNKKKLNENYYLIKWNKPLPDDIDSTIYIYENGELKAV